MARRKAAAPGPGERRSTDYAYERIREQIISGAIPAGSPVSQASLAEELGVSEVDVVLGMRDSLTLRGEQLHHGVNGLVGHALNLSGCPRRCS